MTLSRLEIESWTQRILDQIELHQPVEDDLVEVKAEWPTDFGKIARRIAGHANSAGQHPILWIIGADEKAGIVKDAAPMDPATWYAQVKSEFADRWAPDIAVHNVPRNGHVVVALVFYTESAPYLVKAGPDRFDIPWRSSTAVRSARREEVFRIFTTEVVDFPDFKLREVNVRALANRVQPPGTIVGHTFDLSALLYVIPRSAKAVFFPLYDTLFRIITNGGDAIDISELRHPSTTTATTRRLTRVSSASRAPPS